MAFTLEDAIIMASRNHAGQTDKLGEPYILHPVRVMSKLSDPAARIVAVLHDVIEDTTVTINQDDDSARFVSKERFLSTLGYLCGKSGEVYLIVRRNRKLSKFKAGNSIYQDSPDTPQDERSIAKKVAKDIPALMLIHQDGTGEGWNGCEFWWPVISVQQNVKMTIFALPDPDGKIKR